MPLSSGCKIAIVSQIWIWLSSWIISRCSPFLNDGFANACLNSHLVALTQISEGTEHSIALQVDFITATFLRKHIISYLHTLNSTCPFYLLSLFCTLLLKSLSYIEPFKTTRRTFSERYEQLRFLYADSDLGYFWFFRDLYSYISRYWPLEIFSNYVDI